MTQQVSDDVGLVRYELDVCDGESGRCRAKLLPEPDGDWVLYSDYAAHEQRRVAQVNALREVLAETETRRVSDERLAKMRLATAFIDPLGAQDDIIAVIDDLRDARAALMKCEAERRALVEAGVRAGMEWAGAGKGRPTGTTISLPPDLAARVLAEFDKEGTSDGSAQTASPE